MCKSPVNTSILPRDGECAKCGGGLTADHRCPSAASPENYAPPGNSPLVAAASQKVFDDLAKLSGEDFHAMLDRADQGVVGQFLEDTGYIDRLLEEILAEDFSVGSPVPAAGDIP